MSGREADCSCSRLFFALRPCRCAMLGGRLCANLPCADRAPSEYGCGKVIRPSRSLIAVDIIMVSSPVDHRRRCSDDQEPSAHCSNARMLELAASAQPQRIRCASRPTATAQSSRAPSSTAGLRRSARPAFKAALGARRQRQAAKGNFLWNSHFLPFAVRNR